MTTTRKAKIGRITYVPCPGWEQPAWMVTFTVNGKRVRSPEFPTSADARQWARDYVRQEN